METASAYEPCCLQGPSREVTVTLAKYKQNLLLSYQIMPFAALRAYLLYLQDFYFRALFIYTKSFSATVPWGFGVLGDFGRFDNPSSGDLVSVVYNSS